MVTPDAASVRLERAKFLLGVRRFRDAERELRAALALEPENALLHAHLALCLAEDATRAREAARAALQATVNDPILPAAWYACSLVEMRHGSLEDAERTARIALSLSVEGPRLLAHLAQVLLHRGRLPEAREAAVRALALAPRDVSTLMVAGAVCSRLGRHDEGAEYFRQALEIAPEDPALQTNAGWAALRRGAAAAALENFRAALRLTPGEPLAQRGILEALRARNPAYRLFLRGALRLYWIPRSLKWMTIGVCLLAVAFVSVSGAPPWLLVPLQAGLVAAAVSTWTARPLADLLLLAEPAGRAVVGGAQRASAVAVAALLVLAAGLGVAWRAGGPAGTGMGAVMALLYSVPVAAVPHAPPGRYRAWVAVCTAALAVPAIATVVLHVRQASETGALLGLTVSALCILDIAADPDPWRLRR